MSDNEDFEIEEDEDDLPIVYEFNDILDFGEGRDNNTYLTFDNPSRFNPVTNTSEFIDEQE